MKNTANTLDEPNNLDQDDVVANDAAPESGVFATAERSQRFAEQQQRLDREKRQDQAAEAKIRKREQMLATVQQEILMSGVTLNIQEMKDLFDAIVALVETATPEAGRHITAFLERLGQHTQKTSKLRDEGFGGQAITDTVKFLVEEEATINKIPDRHIRDQVKMLLGYAINADKLNQEIKGLSTKKWAWDFSSGFIPFSGLVDLYEATGGRTIHGEKISNPWRVAKAAYGAARVGASIATFGTSDFVVGLAKKVAGIRSVQGALFGVASLDSIQKLQSMPSAIKQTPAVTAGIGSLHKIGGIVKKCPALGKFIANTPDTAVGVKAVEIGVKGVKYLENKKNTKNHLASVKETRATIDRATGNAGAKMAIDHARKNRNDLGNNNERLAA